MTLNQISQNDAHFTADRASKYDTPVLLRIGQSIASAMLNYSGPLLPKTNGDDTLGDQVNEFWAGSRILDFACGTGIVSLALAPHVGLVTGVDISNEMIKVFEQKLRQQKAGESTLDGTGENVSVKLVNIFEKEEVQKLEAEQPKVLSEFDAAVSSLAYHHVDSIDQASHALFERIRPGGYVFVADIAKHAGHELKKQTEVPSPNGFTQEELKASLEKAGFEQVDTSQSFTIRDLWETEEWIKWFGTHHVVSKEDDAEGEGIKDIEDVRVYGEKDGLYEYRLKMNLAVARKPL